jgi:iron complex outermembrane receptor protein
MRMRRTGSPWRQAAFRLAALSSTALCAPALAQTAEPEPVAELSPVVVSARREQPQQTAPQSITTLDRGFIESSGVEDVADIALSVPGVVVSDQNASFGSANIFIRGVGTAVRGVGVSTGVALYRDGVYQPSPTAILSAFNDLERIEVMRGPQGALQGRNATGGAILLISRAPSDVFAAEGDVSAGSFGMRQTRASANLPVVQDRLAVRGAVIAERRESYTRNLRRAEAGLDPDLDADLLAFRGSGLARLSDKVTLTGRASHLRDEAYGKFEARNAAPGGLFTLATAVFKLPPPSSNGADPHEVRSDVLNPVGTLEQSELSAELKADLGFATLRLISAVQSEELLRVIDGDGTDTPLSFNRLSGEGDAYSHELQLVSPGGGRWTWLAGVYLFGQDARQVLGTEVFAGAVKTSFDATLDNQAYAAFGQVDWRATPTLQVSVGLRYSDETKRHRLLINNAVAPASTGKLRDQDVSPSLIVQWRPRPGLMSYLSAAKGFKAGGFNSTQNQAPYGQETIWNYEAGVKATWLGGRMITNASAFAYRYDQLQTQVPQASAGGTVSVLTPDAEAVGGEFELVAKPVRAALIRFGLSLLDAEISSDLVATNTATGAPSQVKGNRLPRAPRLTLNALAEYGFQFAFAKITPRLEVQHTSAQDFDLFNNAAARQGAYTLLNAGLTLAAPNDRVSLQLFAKNLTDEAYRLASVAATAPSGVGLVDFWGTPKTYGARLQLRF